MANQIEIVGLSLEDLSAHLMSHMRRPDLFSAARQAWEDYFAEQTSVPAHSSEMDWTVIEILHDAAISAERAWIEAETKSDA